MLIDNRQEIAPGQAQKTVKDFMQYYAALVNSPDGELDVVTGYFTIGGLEWLITVTRGAVSRYRFVIGDYQEEKRTAAFPRELLGDGDLGMSGALQLRAKAEAVAGFLEAERVQVRTVEPNFCHAKAYIFRHPKAAHAKFYVMGSSNLSLSALGLAGKNSNIEINAAESGDASLLPLYTTWFDRLFHDLASEEKHLAGKAVSYKAYLIGQIRRIFAEHSPLEVYQRALCLYYPEPDILANAAPMARVALTRLQDTSLWKTLFDFQRKGVVALINMLDTYGGGMLGDAVGLGKTWQALAVMHFYARQGYDVWVFCPKRLEATWRKYLAEGAKFVDCNFDYRVRFHTDLQGDRLDRAYSDLTLKHLRTDRPRLFVIDESHNFRNGAGRNADQPNRYAKLVAEVLSQNRQAKVLLLTATPVNNSFLDLENQFRLAGRGREDAFGKLTDNETLHHVFQTEGNRFRDALAAEGNPLTTLYRDMSAAVKSLMSELLLARTREMITASEPGLSFPKRGILRDANNDGREDDINVTPLDFGDFHSFEDVWKAVPKRLSAYLPSLYLQPREGGTVTETQQRDVQLAGMLHMLLAKRLESSWHALWTTLRNIRETHESVRTALLKFRDAGVDRDIAATNDELEQQRREAEDDDVAGIGKRNIRPSQIAAAGRLDDYIGDLTDDIAAFNGLLTHLDTFAGAVEAEHSAGGPTLRESRDVKLTELMRLIEGKPSWSRNSNDGRQKIVVFTSFKDTARYLFDALRQRGFERLAMVAGDESRTWDRPDTVCRDFTAILKRFCPRAQLFLDADWPDFPPSRDEAPGKTYVRWQAWVAKARPEIRTEYLGRPIDILIATDCISEGQNLQDADTVVNYDVHWNPVRVIQRFGRVDRLGSLNDEVYCVTFWPCKDLDSTLGLRRLVTGKMLGMLVAGSEIHPDLTEALRRAVDGAEDVKTSLQQRAFKKMNAGSLDALEDEAQGLCAAIVAAQAARLDHLELFTSGADRARDLPDGVFSGFVVSSDALPRDAVIALLGIPAAGPKKLRTYPDSNVVCVDLNGSLLMEIDAPVLEFLSRHKLAARWVPAGLDAGDPELFGKVSRALIAWRDLVVTGPFDPTSSASVQNLAYINAGKGPRFANPDVLCWFYVTAGDQAGVDS